MQRFTRLTRLLGFGLLSALLSACGSDHPPTPEIPAITALPSGRHLLLATTVSGTERGYEFLVLTPGDPTLRAWSLQDGRGLTENGNSGRSSQDSFEWDPSTRTLTVGGSFGEQSGLNRISADGKVTNIARLIWADEPGGTLAHILRDGAVEIPSGVENLSYYRHAHSSDSFAFSGTIYTNPGVPGNARDSLYVVDAQNNLAVYGEGLDLSNIADIRWSPDDSLISFTALIESDAERNRRVFRLDRASGAIVELSAGSATSPAATILIDASAEFLSDNAIIFSGAYVDDQSAPMFFYAAADETIATALVSLDSLPQIAEWRGEFLISPDETQVAFVAQRDNPTTPWTIYVADLESSAIRDLLPPDLAVTRSGSSEEADSPFMSLHTWDPEGQHVLFSSSLTGYCSSNNMAGVVNCTSQLYRVSAEGGSPEYMSEMHMYPAYALWIE